MEHRDTYGYIYLGTAVRYLMDIERNTPIHPAGTLLDNIVELDRLLSDYEFHVTSRLAQPLVAMAAGWVAEAAEHLDDEGWRDSRTLSDGERSELKVHASHIRETMLAEAKGKVSFIASDKRFTVDKLINDVGSLMAPGTYDSLPDLAKYDFEEGGKAIAFDLPTAAAFHLLRGTEAVLRDFYCRVVRRDRIREPRMWAAMIAGMRGKRNAPSDLLLGNLDSLRSNFRNPTQHPEKVYDTDEVQDLLALAVDSVNRMNRHLAERSL